METTDGLNVIHARAAGVDVHKMQLTATVRLAQPGDQAQTFTRVFSALPSGITALVDWLLSHEVVAAAMEATGIYWETVYDALAGAGVKPMLLHAQHVKQIRDGRPTSPTASGSPASVSSGSARPAWCCRPTSGSCARSRVCGARSWASAPGHATGPTRSSGRAGIRASGVLSNLFGVNGRTILNGLIAGASRQAILASLSYHVRQHHEILHDALSHNLTPRQHFLLQDHLVAFDTADRRIAEYDAVISGGLAEYRTQVDLLTTLPGVDVYSASAMLIELGPDIPVFPSARHCAAWAGLCPGNNESAGKRRVARSRKGNPCARS